MLLLWSQSRAGSPPVTNAAIASISGTTITVTGTTGIDLSGGVWGVEYTVGTVSSLPSGYAFSVNTAGAASSQSIARPDASDGVIATSIVNIRAYYNLDPLDPTNTRVYANALAPFGIAGAAPTGTPTSGQTLTGVTGVMAGSDGMMLSYQWQRDGGTGTWVDINGATSANYVLTDTDIGSNIRRGIKATNSAGNSGFVNSASAGPVAAAGMALVQAWTSNTGTNPVGLTLSSNPTPGNIIIACYGSDAAIKDASISDNFGDANTWTVQKHKSYATVDSHIYIATKVVGSGVTDKKITITNNGFTWTLAAAEYSNPDSGNLIDGLAVEGTGNNNQPTQPSSAITTTRNSDVLVAVMAKTGAIIAGNNGFSNVITSNPAGIPFHVEALITSASGSQNPSGSWIDSANAWVIIAVAVKGAS